MTKVKRGVAASWEELWENLWEVQAGDSRRFTRSMTGAGVRGFSSIVGAAIAGLFLLTACSHDDSAKPSANTPLPTREKTIGRVEQSLQKADDETAKRREEIDSATK